MTTYETHDKDDFDLPEAAIHLGTDSTGTEHYLVAKTQMIYALEGDVVVAMDLTERTVQSYVDHFDAKRGWDEVHYSDLGMGDWLLSAIQDAAAETQEAC